MPIARTKLARFLFASATLALLSVYGYYCGLEWLAKWAFANQSYFAVDELVLITVAQKDISSQTAYLLHEGEFEWHGEMVDVLHRELRSDSVYVYAFRDKAETQLKQEASWLFRDSAQPDQPLQNHTKRTKWLSPFVLPSSTGIAPVGSLLASGMPYFFSYNAPRIRFPLLDVFAPPPNS